MQTNANYLKPLGLNNVQTTIEDEGPISLDIEKRVMEDAV